MVKHSITYVVNLETDVENVYQFKKLKLYQSMEPSLMLRPQRVWVSVYIFLNISPVVKDGWKFRFFTLFLCYVKICYTCWVGGRSYDRQWRQIDDRQMRDNE